MVRYALLIAVSMTPAAAQAAPTDHTGQSKLVDSVLACRTIVDSAQRLACFDASTQSLQSATARHDVVVVDRDEVRKERRSLFGFNIANLKILGSGDKDNSATEEEDKEINSTVRSARTDGEGNWVIVLDDGAIWQQTDGVTLGRSPKPGMAVTIRRGALGSYFMRAGTGSGFKVRRES